jgi:cytidylate kinase
MTGNLGEVMYYPGMYDRLRRSPSELAKRFLREWAIEIKDTRIPITICFSRMIGVGVLEIADLLGEKLGYRVVDRQIMEYIATQADLSEKTVALFDERYPGRMRELLALLFGEKAFVESDYTRQLFSAVLSIAGIGNSILVGRGAHLILRRDRVLAVRFIGSKSFRAQRLAKILEISEDEADKKLSQMDKEQQAFFKGVFNKKEVSPYEFDLVINCDYLDKPQWATEIVAEAFYHKFGDQVKRPEQAT